MWIMLPAAGLRCRPATTKPAAREPAP